MNGDPRVSVVTAPHDAGAVVRYAEALYRGRPAPEAEAWLRRARRLAPGAGFVLHSSALAARQAGDRDGAVRAFRAEAVLDPRATKALSRMVDDLDAAGREATAGQVARWLLPLGRRDAGLEARAVVARLRAAADWRAVERAIDAASPTVAAQPAVVDALWAVCGRLPGTGAANAAWRRLAARAGTTPAVATAIGLTGLAALPTGPAIEAWLRRPAADVGQAASAVLKHAPRLRPLAEAASAASIALPDGTLLEALRNAGLVAVDIGARGLPLGDAPLLPAVATVVAVDADDAVAGELAAALGDLAGWHDLRPLTATLGERAERRRLRLTRQAGLSSLLDPNRDVAATLGMTDGLEILESRAVDAVPLEQALRPLGLPAPSHLKLDTQGTELEILRGAEETVRDHALSVQVEVEFRALYEGQPLFGDVDRFLVERGFELVLLRRNLRRLGTEFSDVPSRLELGWGHALYVRTLDDFASKQPDWAAVVRYCAIAMAYRLTDRALMLLHRPAVVRRYPAARSLARALTQMARAWPEQVDQSQGRAYRKDRW